MEVSGILSFRCPFNRGSTVSPKKATSEASEGQKKWEAKKFGAY